MSENMAKCPKCGSADLTAHRASTFGTHGEPTYAAIRDEVFPRWWEVQAEVLRSKKCQRS